MDLQEIHVGNVNLVRGYGPEQIRVNDQDYGQSLVLFAEAMWLDWLPLRFEDLQVDHLEPFIRENVELILLGTGGRIRFPNPALTAPLTESGIGVEVMDTPAACRTYNLLVSEQRIVAAVLLMIEADQSPC